jgi:hypothetical protein
MSVAWELRPDGTVTAGSWTIVGGAPSLHAALDDGSDATGALSSSGAAAVLSLSGPSLPAGSTIQAVCAVVRLQRFVTGSRSVTVTVATEVGGSTRRTSWTIPAPNSVTEVVTVWTTSLAGSSWTEERLQAARLELSASSGDVEVYEARLDAMYNQPPTVVLDSLDPVTDTTTPELTWDYSDPEGDPQQAFRVLLFNQATDKQVHSSGWQFTADTSHRLPPLDNGATYRAELEVLQSPSLGMVATDSTVFTVDLDAPAAPDVLLIPYPDDGYVTLEIDDPTVAPDPAAQWFTVESRISGGEWLPVRAAQEVAAPGPVLVVHVEVPLQTPHEWRVRSHAIVSGQQVSSLPTVVTGTLESQGRWLTDPRDPSGLNIKVHTIEHGRSLQGREVVHEPVGMDVAVVESEPPILRQSLEVWALDPAEHRTLEAALRSQRTLLYRDWRSTVYFRWVGERTMSQHAKDWHDTDRMSGTMVEVARPSV